MKIKIIILLIFTFLSHSSVIRANFSDDNLGTTGGQFLKLTKGVRPAGMGEAYCAVKGDINAIYSNPAGLAQIKNTQISAMHTLWFEEIFYEHFSAAVPTDIGVMALSLNYLGMSDIDKYNRYRVALDDKYRPYDILGYLSYATNLNDNFFGVNVFMLRSVIEDESASAYGADLGYIRNINEQIDAGLSIQNIGTTVKFRDEEDPLPLNIKAGMTYQPMESLLLAIDVNFPRDKASGVNAGGEYSYIINDLTLSTRAGYRTAPIDVHGGLSGLSVGGGVGYRGLFFDYAWVPYGDLDSTHRFSLSYRFSGENELK